MCNLYSLADESTRIAAAFGAMAREDSSWESIIVPRKPAPTVIVGESGTRELTAMRFGLTPVGSKEPEAKRPLNNARWENLESWPWKLSISHRCVLPLSKFREPLYWGDDAGTQAYFYPADESLLAVAGLYNVWRRGDLEVATMTFIMRPACSYVMRFGHHRQPFFIEFDSIDEWLTPAECSVDNAQRLLRDIVAEPELMHAVDVEMKPAWKSRAKGNQKKRDEQLAAIEEFGPLGA